MTFPRVLVDGYRAFVTDRLPGERTRLHHLAEHGQSPRIMVIGCCDSRVAPEMIFAAQPGELFVVRNVANLVPPCTPDGSHDGIAAALEFAVVVLAVDHIVVLGHARCGGVRAFAERLAPLSRNDFIGKWVALMTAAATAAGPCRDRDTDHLTLLAQASIAASLDNLSSYPYVREHVERGALTLHGAYFEIGTGGLSVRDPVTGGFEPIPESARTACPAVSRPASARWRRNGMVGD